MPAPSKRVEPNKTVGGLWVGLPIATNPWNGTDRHVMATIRSRMEPAARGVPDGPPLHTRAAANYFLHLADGVEEAYAAVYAQGEQDLVAVYAVKLAGGETRGDRASTRRVLENRLAARIQIGPISALVSGSGGPCFDAIETYVMSLPAAR